MNVVREHSKYCSPHRRKHQDGHGVSPITFGASTLTWTSQFRSTSLIDQGLYSVEEDCNGSQLHPGEEISRKLVVTCGDGAEVLEQIEEALDQIAFTIECEVPLPLDVSVGLGRNDRSDSTLGESFDERIGVISFVANQGLWVGVLDQRFRASKIMILAWCKHQFDRIAQSVDKRMYLGRQSAARSADRLRAVFFRAPALCW